MQNQVHADRGKSVCVRGMGQRVDQWVNPHLGD